MNADGWMESARDGARASRSFGAWPPRAKTRAARMMRAPRAPDNPPRPGCRLRPGSRVLVGQGPMASSERRRVDRTLSPRSPVGASPMRLDRNPARPPRLCKIKRVDPAFRSVSTPRGTKDLPVVGPVNPAGSLGRPGKPSSAFEWSPERLCERLRIELAPGAWARLIRAAGRCGATLAQLLHSDLSEVA
jgi:hypothetical protein